MNNKYMLWSLLALSGPSLVMAVGYGGNDTAQSNNQQRYYYNAPTPQDYGPSPQEGYYDPQTHRLDGGYYYYAPQNIRPGYPNSSNSNSGNSGSYYYNQPSGQGQMSNAYPQTVPSSGMTNQPNAAPSVNSYSPSNDQGTGSNTGGGYFYSQPSQSNDSSNSSNSYRNNDSSMQQENGQNPSSSYNTTPTQTDRDLQNRISNTSNNSNNSWNNRNNSSSNNENNSASNNGNITALEVNTSKSATTTETRRPFQSDQTIAEKVRESLKKGLLSKGYENIDVKVYNGIVTLKGTVETENEKREVKNRVLSIPGVESVTDQIQIKATAKN